MVTQIATFIPRRSCVAVATGADGELMDSKSAPAPEPTLLQQTVGLTQLLAAVNAQLDKSDSEQRAEAGIALTEPDTAGAFPRICILLSGAGPHSDEDTDTIASSDLRQRSHSPSSVTLASPTFTAICSNSQPNAVTDSRSAPTLACSASSCADASSGKALLQALSSSIAQLQHLRLAASTASGDSQQAGPISDSEAATGDVFQDPATASPHLDSSTIQQPLQESSPLCNQPAPSETQSQVDSFGQAGVVTASEQSEHSSAPSYSSSPVCNVSAEMQPIHRQSDAPSADALLQPAAAASFPSPVQTAAGKEQAHLAHQQQQQQQQLGSELQLHSPQQDAEGVPEQLPEAEGSSGWLQLQAGALISFPVSLLAAAANPLSCLHGFIE